MSQEYVQLLLGKTLFLWCFLRVWEVANDSWAPEGVYKQELGVNTWYWVPRIASSIKEWGCYVLMFLCKDVRDKKSTNIYLQKWLS